MTQPVSSQCPKCGFDLEPGKACQVCGFQPSNDAAEIRGASRRPGRRGSLGVLAVSAVGLLAVLALFILLDKKGRTDEVDSAGAAAPLAGIVTAVPTTEANPAASSAAQAPSAPSAPQATPAPTAVATAPKAPAEAKPAAAQPPLAGPVLLSSPTQIYDITSRIEGPPATDKASFVAWMRAHTDQTQKFLEQKWDLAQGILRDGSVTHARVLEAFLLTPREYFARDARRAYENAVLPIGYGQTISGPYMVGRMTDYLDPQPGQKVLEIGTGSGYQSALLSELTNHLYTIEIVEALARETDAIYRMRQARYPEYGNIHRKIDDGYYGWAQYAPFDRIIVTCGIDHVPPELLKQLAPEGIMVIPVGPPSGQTILRIIKHVGPDGSVSLDREDIFHGKKKVIFVPFTSGQGGIHKTLDSPALK